MFSRMASLSASPSYCSMSPVRMMPRTFSLTPTSAGSKSTKWARSTMPFVKMWTSLPSAAFTQASVTPQLSMYCARSKFTTSPASAIISPVTGSATGAASAWPMRRPEMESFLLNL